MGQALVPLFFLFAAPKRNILAVGHQARDSWLEQRRVVSRPASSRAGYPVANARRAGPKDCRHGIDIEVEQVKGVTNLFAHAPVQGRYAVLQLVGRSKCVFLAPDWGTGDYQGKVLATYARLIGWG